MKAVVDIKTGHAEPWAALQTAAYSAMACLPRALKEGANFSPDNHSYTHEGIVYPSVTQILQAEGFINTDWYDDYSRDRGSLVHLTTHYDDTEELDEESVDDVIWPYLKAWRKFKKETGFVIEQIEVPLVNPAFSYAGTPDRIGTFPNQIFTRCAVELHNDGKYKIVPHTDKNDHNVFMAAVACFHWKQNNNIKRR